MRRSTLAGVASALAALVCLGAQHARAADADEQVAPAFGNTVMSVYPDGRSQKIWMHPDGTWDGRSRRGSPLSGRWAVRDDRVCVRQSKPPTLPISFCIPFPQNPEVGSSWSARDVMGIPITLKILKGTVAG